jgi:hypothetical protein
MACDCISTINKNMIGQQYDKKPIISARLKVAYVFPKKGGLETTTYNDMEIETEGSKRPKIVKIFPSFCPFCGKKIEKHPEI